jgi:UDP-GlcNAc:undecaprenyl-phosphate GlcNAc-1-phosphate transferase
LKAPATVAIALPIALLILPIFDTTAAIVRRTVTGRSIYTTDRGHLHHCLLRYGLSLPWALVLVAACCLVACVSVLASQAFNNEGIALITAASIVAIFIATRLFGHAELMLVKARVVSMLWRVGGVSDMEVRLQGTVAWRELWQAIKQHTDAMNLQSILLDVNAPALHESYHARWDRASDDSSELPGWRAEIPLTSTSVSVGRLVLVGKPDQQPVWVKIALIMKVIEDFHQPNSSVNAAPAPPAFEDVLGLEADSPSSAPAKKEALQTLSAP